MSRFLAPLRGDASRRVHGMAAALRDRATTARDAAAHAVDERAAAALRGKATAYLEAAQMADAVERGWVMPWRRRSSR